MEVIHPGDEVPEPRRVGEVNLAAELSVGALGQNVVGRVNCLEHAAAAAQRGAAVGGVISAIDREPLLRRDGSVDAGLNGRAALMRSAERTLVFGLAAVGSRDGGAEDVVIRIVSCVPRGTASSGSDRRLRQRRR